MLKKSYSKTKKYCRVTFKFTPENQIEKVALLGDFNSWGKEGLQLLSKRKDGSYSVTISLEANNDYKFRYLIDDKEWTNDEEADDYVANPYGAQDAVLKI